MNILLNAGLVLHISGISLMVGMTVANFVTYRQLWKLLPQEKERAMSLITSAGMFSRLQLFGGILIILGGALMLIVFHGLIMRQVWFKVKLLLLLLLILNAVLNARPAAIHLRFFLVAEQPVQVDFNNARQLFNRFHVLQFLIFIGIFILSVFRFN